MWRTICLAFATTTSALGLKFNYEQDVRFWRWCEIYAQLQPLTRDRGILGKRKKTWHDHGMSKLQRNHLRYSAIAALAITACACVVGFAKPVRISFAHLLSVHCAGPVCFEHEADRASTEKLYQTAVSEMNTLFPLKRAPRFIFCRTRTCYQLFGGGQERAISYPWLGTIIAPESWQPYIVKHELVHWLQFQEFGVMGTMQKPLWLREGMAYALSKAPGHDIPRDHMEWVYQYEAWATGKTMRDIWSEGSSIAPTFRAGRQQYEAQ